MFGELTDVLVWVLAGVAVNWQQYTEMLTKWARGTDTFETTLVRVSETSDLVYFEIEERHFVGEAVIVVNSMSVFEFDADSKIRRLNVYLQRAA